MKTYLEASHLFLDVQTHGCTLATTMKEIFIRSGQWSSVFVLCLLIVPVKEVKIGLCLSTNLSKS